VQHAEVYADRQQAEVTRSYSKWRSNKRPAAASLSPVAAERPQAYFGGAVALSKVIRWEVGQASEFDRVLTPEEIMDKLEQRVGPEGRKLFEQFLRKVNTLQAKQLAAKEARRIVRSESR
jgi:hypothetical protein